MRGKRTQGKNANPLNPFQPEKEVNDMNKVMLTGNLARDPESKTMSNGKQRTMFTLAVSRPYTDADGQRSADFITCIAFDKTAEIISKYLTKGQKAGVEGHIRTGRYEKDGHTIYTTEIHVDRIEFLSSARSDQKQENSTPANTAQPDYPEGYTMVDDEDLPF